MVLLDIPAQIWDNGNMTYEELLKDIDDQEFAYDTLATCIRAVVELHKAYESMQGTACLECSEDDYACPYPCPTIQAIEKELQ